MKKKKKEEKYPAKQNPKTFTHPVMPEDITQAYIAEGFTFPSNRHSH